MGIGILGVFLAGGCLLACLGLAGLGFALPAVNKARQAAQAEANARQRQAAEAALRQAAEETARTVESPAAKPDGEPLAERTNQPEQDEIPEKNGDRRDDM
jgi:Tfp pilus assembly protein PilX